MMNDIDRKRVAVARNCYGGGNSHTLGDESLGLPLNEPYDNYIQLRICSQPAA